MIRQLEEAQEYLTVTGNGCTKSIFPLETLLRRHGPVKVYWTLKRLLTEKRARLQALLEVDKGQQEVDRIVAEMFRIHMAISLIKEVIPSEQTQPGAGGGSEFQRRHSSSGGVSWERQDQDHDRAYSTGWSTNHKIAPESILGVTFTRNAAEEMRNRLKPVLGDLADRVMLSTVHSFCFWVLKNEGYVFEILYGKDQIIFMRDIIKKLRFRELPPAMVLREISLSKNNLVLAEDMKILYEGDKTMLKVADVYQRYDEEKRKKMLLDFDDLLVETYKLLEQDEQVKSKYRLMFRHLLVDEFQDTNPVQLEILRLLIDGDSHDASFWVCGDDWQSIYAFVGASLGNILNFKEMFPQVQRVHFESQLPFDATDH